MEAATGVRRLTDEELQHIIEHVAGAGFDADAHERARGRLAGLNWHGQLLRGGDMLSPAEVHYLRHVIAQREWPEDTTLEAYTQSIVEAALSPAAGIFASRFRNRGWQLSVIVPTGQWLGPRGREWILVEYRLSTGHWVTAYQLSDTWDTIAGQPQRSDARWLWR
ncbi:MAG: hypothetical protein EXR50_03240 [Dehalococcoidia bacterium]|nr:hypothetical protein [Dehalococcoidia bacterium]